MYIGPGQRISVNPFLFFDPPQVPKETERCCLPRLTRSLSMRIRCLQSASESNCRRHSLLPPPKSAFGTRHGKCEERTFFYCTPLALPRNSGFLRRRALEIAHKGEWLARWLRFTRHPPPSQVVNNTVVLQLNFFFSEKTATTCVSNCGQQTSTATAAAGCGRSVLSISGLGLADLASWPPVLGTS